MACFLRPTVIEVSQPTICGLRGVCFARGQSAVSGVESEPGAPRSSLARCKRITRDREMLSGGGSGFSIANTLQFSRRGNEASVRDRATVGPEALSFGMFLREPNLCAYAHVNSAPNKKIWAE